MSYMKREKRDREIDESGQMLKRSPNTGKGLRRQTTTLDY